MNYSTAFKYIFDNPKWGVNVLLGGVCQLIPIVGPIVFQGYLCEVIDARLTPMGDAALAPTAPGAPVNYQVPPANYPNFDFNRFTEYLLRGVWPFLITLVLTIPMVFLMVFLILLAEIPVLLAIVSKSHGVVAGLLILAACGLYVLVILLAPVLMTPFILRGMLARNFAAAFDFKFAVDFVRRVGLVVLLNSLVTMAVSFPLMIGGMLLCLVGLYPAIAILGLFHAELLAQTYRVYLLRGGTPIPVAATIPRMPASAALPPKIP